MDNTHKAKCNVCSYHYNNPALETLLLNAIQHYWEQLHTVVIHLSDGDLLGYIDSDSCGTIDQTNKSLPDLTESRMK